jgi:hypothetical protein
MSRAASTFRQTDVVRALRAARAAGLEVARIEIGKDGKIVVIPGKPTPCNQQEEGFNDWADAR